MTAWLVGIQIFACFYSAYKVIVAKDNTYTLPEGILSAIWAGTMLVLGFDALTNWPQALTYSEIATSLISGASLGIVLWLGANIPNIRKRLSA